MFVDISELEIKTFCHDQIRGYDTSTGLFHSDGHTFSSFDLDPEDEIRAFEYIDLLDDGSFDWPKMWH